MRTHLSTIRHELGYDEFPGKYTESPVIIPEKVIRGVYGTGDSEDNDEQEKKQLYAATPRAEKQDPIDTLLCNMMV